MSVGYVIIAALLTGMALNAYDNRHGDNDNDDQD